MSGVYKPCDIRGDARSELDPVLYRAWGLALAGLVPAGSDFVVGGDVRSSTPAFQAALIQGLTQGGTQVSDLGHAVPTPLVYFAQRQLRAAGCAIVTASHNPPRFNGLKWMIGGRPPGVREVADLAAAAENSDALSPSDTPNIPPGEIHRVDLADEYVSWLAEAWGKSARDSALRFVLDPGSGCWSARAAAYLAEVFPRYGISTIHDVPDGSFPHRDPDCSRPDHLSDLSRAVVERRADLGLAFDGDGDRLAFVDHEGVALTAEQATLLLVESFADDWPGRTFVYDLKYSDRVPEAARRLGANAVAERSGHAFIRAKMLDEGALFGAEISGHYFYQSLGACDDALWTACRALDYLTATGQRLADWRRRCPANHMTPDLRLRVSTGDASRILAEVRAAFADLPQSTIDGVRIEFPDGWALIRASVTEPVITLRFEGDSPLALASILTRIRQQVPSLDELGLGPLLSPSD